MTTVKVTNFGDLEAIDRGNLLANRLRSEELQGLVDTGATDLCIPEDVRARLGLRILGHRNVRYADGRLGRVPWVNVHIEILGREMTCDAMVHPNGTTPLIGQFQLQGLDLLVDPGQHEVRVNPRSPDVPMIDIFGAA